jgi:hypothetical protein
MTAQNNSVYLRSIFSFFLHILRITSMLKSTFLLAFALAGALFIGGCNENTTDPVTGTKPNAPTAIMAQSASATSVKIKWTAPIRYI